MNYRSLWRKSLNAVMFSLTGICALLTVSVLFFILGYLLWNGGRAINWAFFTQLPKPVGETGGGMANAIVGSAKLLLLAMLTGVPVGFMGGVYLAEFGGKTFSFLVRYTTDLLNGVPSIVMGIFAYTMIVLPMKHFSTLAGGLALGVMMIPIAVRSTEEFLRTVPQSLREAALAVGASKWKAVVTVVIPAAFRGILTGIVLDVARVAGETAPLLFTAFNNRFWSPGWDQPTASLPVMIFTYAIAPYEDWHRQAWAAGLVLLALVLLANITARVVLSRRLTSAAGYL
ncbi:MAG: phosphate ABC transporter permease PstA [Terriglobia bacterium]